jgi:rifampicin phosphotransferase
VSLGQRIEAHFATPQDIEWCLVDDGFWIVQSRPITTLFPIPPVTDGANHVWVSVGHQQMMTDAMKPLGLSFWQKTTPAPMAEAGSRLFVDVTARLAAPETRAGLFDVLGKSDPLIRDALQIDRRPWRLLEPGSDVRARCGPVWAREPPCSTPTRDRRRPHRAVAVLDHPTAHDIAAKSGTGAVRLHLRRHRCVAGLLFDPRSLQVIMTAIDATWWLDEHLTEWLVTRPCGRHPHVVGAEQRHLRDGTRPARRRRRDPTPSSRRRLPREPRRRSRRPLDLLADLDSLPGGSDARHAIEQFLDDYGMRCVGEIDITRPRWSEQPGALVPVISATSTTPSRARPNDDSNRAVGRQQRKSTRSSPALRALPDGEAKASETKQMIDRVRTFIGYREYPKYAWICHYLEYKRALLREAEQLRRRRRARRRRGHLLPHLRRTPRRRARPRHRPSNVIAARKTTFESHRALTPPRVLTSDGEMLTGTYHRNDLPNGALPGLAVSAGVVEGTARVIHDMAHADVDPATSSSPTHTDPSWSPLFVAISGLVTEVGGVMTHGAVVAREYGLPAVVGVEHATRRTTNQTQRRIRQQWIETGSEVMNGTPAGGEGMLRPSRSDAARSDTS